VAFRGRHWIAFWLVALLAALWLVIARQTSALNAARELDELRDQRAALEGRRAELERRVRTAQSRAVLLPKAQKQGLRLPADTEIILIPAPSEPGQPSQPRQPGERPF
jgi:cell division protein FtsL